MKILEATVADRVRRLIDVVKDGKQLCDGDREFLVVVQSEARYAADALREILDDNGAGRPID